MPNSHSLPEQIVAADIMIRKLITLAPDLDVFAGIDILTKSKISGAPVVDHDRRLLGVFSEDSCMQVLVCAAYEQLPTNQIRAFMDPTPRTIGEATDLLSIIQIFQSSNCRRLPVTRPCQNAPGEQLSGEQLPGEQLPGEQLPGEQLVGQISRRDVMHATLKLISKAPTPEASLLYLSALRPRNDVHFG